MKHWCSLAAMTAVVLLLFMAAVPLVDAATYYIDYQSGSDSNNGLSKATPWKRCPGMPQFAGNYVHANGDVFVFKGGVKWVADSTRVLVVANSGSATNPDRYTADKTWYTGAAWDYPIFDGNAVSGMSGVYVRGKNNLVFDSLKFVNMGYTDGSGMGIFFAGCSNIEIKNCVFDVNSINAVAMGGAGSKFYFHDNITRNTGRIHISTGNDAYDDIQFYNNLFEGTETYDPKGYHVDGLMIGADGIDTYKITNLKIYNNKWYGQWRTGATAFIYLNGSPGHYGTQHVQIYNNVLAYENNSTVSGGPVVSPALIDLYYGHDDVKIYNNTLSADAFYGGKSTPSHCIFLAHNVSNVDVKNNIFSKCDNGITIAGPGTSGLTADYNLYFTAGNNHYIWDWNGRYNSLSELHARGYEAHGKAGDPKFVTVPTGGVTGSGNWELRSDSPAHNVGATLSGHFLTDLRAQLRPTGAWTLGAYEGSSVSSTIKRRIETA